jgi:hypothetical protein
MPLNNDGDDVLLLDADGVPVSRVLYTERQVRAGNGFNSESRSSREL